MKNNLDVKALALTIGIVWAAVLFLITIVSQATGYGIEFLRSISSLYPGFEISIKGAFIGAIYGFVDGFLGTYVIAWVYKKLAK